MFCTVPRRACVLALCLWLLTPVGAQDRTFVCDSTNDVVSLMTDLDNNHTIDPLTEVRVFYDDTSSGPDLSTPMHLLPYGAGVLLADAGTLDAILFLADLDGDGDANDPGEVTPFYDDSSPGLDLSTPSGLAHGPGDSVFVVDDGATVRAVLRLTDLNADGDANDAGEVTVYFDASAADPLLAPQDPESIAVMADGTVFVGETTSSRVLRLVDSNGDGDANDPGEARVFYEGSTPVLLQDLDTILIDGSGTVLVVDEENGTVLALVDNNGDGDALDPGEAVVLMDGPTTSISDPNDAVLVAPGVLLIAEGLADALLLARDLNGDGSIDATEITPYFDDAGVLLSTPSGVAFIAGPSVGNPPVVHSLAPAQGPRTGGTSVTFDGTRLTTTLAVRFGNLDAISFTVLSDDALVAVTPAIPQAGVVDVVVETAGGATTLIAAYLYENPVTPPFVVTAVDPALGPPAGGTVVVVEGTGWDPAQTLMVRFGGLLASGVVAASTSIQCVTPPHSPALVDVIVEQGGQTAALPAGYRYLVPFVRGDANRNGSVDIADAVTLLNFLFVPGSPGLCLDALDVNDNGGVALDDAVRLLEYLFGAGNPPGAPFPAAGTDANPGGPGCEE